ncbi:jg20051 [Pararge aegeria aegeria]|uniref:Jg20051 protein n=1 Tax=Pararge aegeria aegeria TaxID=348720 RepID=A0A8S4RAX0_9NEOP|nr:jg20051 [Pararge aegeria aegeria]
MGHEGWEVKKTIIMCQQLEKCGIDFMTIHGRTPAQKSGEVIDVETLKEICEVITIPVIANGGIKTLYDADQLHGILQCSGIMAASGILNNPALFSGYNKTPLSCIKQWMDLKNKCDEKITFQCYHHHLVFMLEKILTKKQKQEFNYLSTFECVDNFLHKHILNDFQYLPLYNPLIDDFVSCDFDKQITDRHSSKCRRCIYKMENLKYRIIYEYELHLGTSAAEKTRRINDVYDGGVAKENTVRFWCQRFRLGNLDLQNKPRGRPVTKVDNEELKAIVKVYPY